MAFDSSDGKMRVMIIMSDGKMLPTLCPAGVFLSLVLSIINVLWACFSILRKVSEGLHRS